MYNARALCVASACKSRIQSLSLYVYDIEYGLAIQWYAMLVFCVSFFLQPDFLA